MNKVLVTGTKGFVGAKLRAALGESRQYCELNEEILDQSEWKNALLHFLERERPETIFHVGACSDTLEQNVQYMMVRNYESTKVLVDWSIENNCKMIYSSSAANYGSEGMYPSNLYGWSKYAAEDYVRLNNGVSLRYFNVYGPGEDHKGRMASFFLQAHMNYAQGVPVVLFPKKPLRDFVFIDDVVSANFFAESNYPKLMSGVFDVGSCTARAFEDGLNHLGIPYEYAPEEAIPVGYQFYTKADNSKTMPGWSPLFQLEDGLTAYLNTWK